MRKIDDSGYVIHFRPGTRLRKTVEMVIVKHDAAEDEYTLRDADGSYVVSTEAMHDGTWDVIPDA
jgi:hypothetical protein